MQLDLAERGFSFMRDGPLDMRMGQAGLSAEDIVNDAPEAVLADILFHYGEERAARRIAKAITAERAKGRITSTLQLAAIIEGCLPRKKPGQSHPATRSFQAIRIAVNDELRQLVDGLEAAERALKPGGKLAVVTFHSLEDRVVKRFLAERASEGGGGSRHAPAAAPRDPGFVLTPKKAIAPDEDEIAGNPRARSSRLRVATRTEAPATPVDRTALGLPLLPEVS
jgi:16S rRNA (cytosine1402-N4)-methyltransferase